MPNLKIIRLDSVVKLPVESKKIKQCGHPQIILDPGYRVVECKKCGQVIDPFDYLIEWANGDRYLNDMRKRLKKTIKSLSERLESLKKEERNVKNRIRIAKKTSGAIERVK